MVDQKQKKDCCGCGACMQACPFQAIVMKEDERGFLFPEIDYDRCKKCGICDRVCGFVEDSSLLSDGEPVIYGVINRDEDARKNSTSGGLFTAISDYILAQNGVVYGAAYQPDLSVATKRAVTPAERDECRGSKYVQCDTNDTYTQVKRDLTEGRLVFYTGTPCHIIGLRSYLQKEYENLITAELVCHGVPNNRMWHEFLHLAENAVGIRVIDACFRDKSKTGWHHPKTKLVYQDGKEHPFFGEQAFFQLFSTNMCLRDSCLYCKFLSYHRPADLTMADYWGIERFKKDFDDNKGTSMLLVNTEKGAQVFDRVKDQLRYFQSDKEHCYQGRLQGRSTIDPRTEQFWEEYQAKGMKYVLVKYTEFSYTRTFARKAIRKIKRDVLRRG